MTERPDTEPVCFGMGGGGAQEREQRGGVAVVHEDLGPACPDYSLLPCDRVRTAEVHEREQPSVGVSPAVAGELQGDLGTWPGERFGVALGGRTAEVGMPEAC